MENTLVKSLYRDTEKYADQTVQVSGWIRNLRDSKAFGFIELNDGSFFKSVQIVFDTELENFKEIAKLPLSSSVKVEGKVIATPGAKQPFEIKAEKIDIEGLSDSDYPLQKKRHTILTYNRSLTSKNKCILCNVPRTFYRSICDSPVLPRAWIRTCSHTNHHW